jgi:hypothetical protein
MWSNCKNIKEENQERKNLKFYKIMAVSSTFIWQRNMDTEKDRLEQDSSGRDEIFKNS